MDKATPNTGSEPAELVKLLFGVAMKFCIKPGLISFGRTGLLRVSVF
jgi:hypothetical protein